MPQTFTVTITITGYQVGHSRENVTADQVQTMINNGLVTIGIIPNSVNVIKS